MPFHGLTSTKNAPARRATRPAWLVALAALACCADTSIRADVEPAPVLARLEATFPAAVPLLSQTRTYPAEVSGTAGFVLSPPVSRAPAVGPSARFAPGPVAPRVSLPANARDPFDVAIPGGSIRVTHAGARPAPGHVERGAVVYEGAAEGTDIVAFATRGGVEELVRLDSPDRRAGYTVDLPRGWRLRHPAALPDLVEVRDERDVSRLRLRARTAWDARGTALPVTVEAEGNRITLAVPATAQAPILVDPLWASAGTLLVPRGGHTATMLPTGSVLVAGGISGTTATSTIAISELYDPVVGTLSATGSLATGRAYHSATLLLSGEVLVAGGVEQTTTPPDPLGSCELYDPSTGEFGPTGGPLAVMRYQHAATRLSGGSVLVVGGIDLTGASNATAELFDPASQTFSMVGSMPVPRGAPVATLLATGDVLVLGADLGANMVSNDGADLYHQAQGTFTSTNTLSPYRVTPGVALLPSGQVLVAGGSEPSSRVPLASAELYDPSAGTFSPTQGVLGAATASPLATVLPTGEVLLEGGVDASLAVSDQASLYEPSSQTFMQDGTLDTARAGHTATLLPSGTVLLTGGFDATGLALDSVEVRIPTTKTVTSLGKLSRARTSHTATTLLSGQVLVVGGRPSNAPGALADSALFNAPTGDFTSTGSLLAPRSDQAATLLPSGDVLVVDGDDTGVSVQEAEIYDPGTGYFSPTGAPLYARESPTATLLSTGLVLIAGGGGPPEETYDPATGTFSATDALVPERYDHCAASLSTNVVLVIGGTTLTGELPTNGELYDPSTGHFTPTQGSMSSVRVNATATALTNGQVLIAGGTDPNQPQSTADLYDPATDTFAPTAGSMSVARSYHTATLLASGQVLIAGGSDSGPAELYDPPSGTFLTTGTPLLARSSATASLLSSGDVLIVGGTAPAPVASAELYDPKTGTFSFVQGGAQAAQGGTMTLLPTNKLLLAGGLVGTTVSTQAQLFDPATQLFTATGSLVTARSGATGTLLPTGQVVIAGGQDSSGNPLAATEVYDPMTRVFTRSEDLATARYAHTATLLSTGDVVFAGGTTPQGPTDSVELLYPSTGTVGTYGHLQVARTGHTAALLGSGQVVFAGGTGVTGAPVTTVEVFDVPSAQTVATSTTPASTGVAATALADGNALLAYDSVLQEYASPSSIRSFGPATVAPFAARLWLSGDAVVCSASACQGFSSAFQTATDTFLQSVVAAASPVTRLADGSMMFLEATGAYAMVQDLPGGAVRPTISSLSATPLTPDSVVTITGTGFEHLTAVGSDGLAAVPVSVPLAFFMPAEGGGPVFGAVQAQWTDTTLQWKVPRTDYPGPGWVHVVVDGVPSVGEFAALLGLANATSCDSDAECAQGFCVGNVTSRVCCDVACNGGCESCLAIEQAPGGQDGYCGPRFADAGATSGCEPTDTTCGTTGHCNGQGDCDYAPAGKLCSTGTGANGVCAGGVCAPTPTTSTTCATTADCTPGTHCDVTGHCAAETFPPAAVDPGGCACKTGRSSGAPWWLALPVALVAALRRRARRATLASSVGLGLVVATTTVSTRADAQDPPTARGPDARVEEARAELHKGLALFNAGDAERALGFFVRSRAIFPAKGNTLDAAICLERLGRLDEALELYEEVLASFSAAFDDEERASVPLAMAALRARVGSLRVSSNVAGAVVVDGRARGRLPLPDALRLMPGRHTVRVLEEGYAAFEQEVDVVAGGAGSLDARLEPLQASGGLRVEDDTLPGADVLVDGVVLGSAPWEGRLAPGIHVVTTRKGDSGSAPTRSAVLQGQTTLVRVASSPLGPVRRLAVTPPSADLLLDGVPVGKGRWEGALPAGVYRLEAAEDGYVPRSITFRQGVDSGPTDRETALVLAVDDTSPRWARKPSGHLSIGALLGYGVGPSFRSDAEDACLRACTSHGVVNGLFAGARVAYELPTRVGLELTVGYTPLTDVVQRTAAAGTLRGGSPVTYDVHDLLRLNAYFLGAGVSYAVPIGSAWSLRTRLTAGVLAAQSTDVITGIATAAQGSAPLGIPGAGDTLTSFPFFVMPEVGLEAPLGPVRVGLQLAALFVPSSGPVYPFGAATVTPTCGPQAPVQIGCARDSAVLENERAYRAFAVVVPQVTGGYVF